MLPFSTDGQRGRWPRWVILLALLGALVAAGCSPDSDTGGQPIQQDPVAIVGKITELDPDFLSVRANDGRQFIFFIADSAFEVETLRVLMDNQTEIKLTYRVVDSRLIPESIEATGT